MSSPHSYDVKEDEMGYARHWAHMVQTEQAYEHLMGKPEGKRPPSFDRGIILKLTLKKQGVDSVDYIRTGSSDDISLMQ